MYTAYKIL